MNLKNEIAVRLLQVFRRWKEWTQNFLKEEGFWEELANHTINT